jgi:hypothetical protein
LFAISGVQVLTCFAVRNNLLYLFQSFIPVLWHLKHFMTSTPFSDKNYGYAIGNDKDAGACSDVN